MNLIKTLWLRWLGYVCRMEEQRLQKGFRNKTRGKKEERKATYRVV
jgi:hypothetical protein